MRALGRYILSLNPQEMRALATGLLMGGKANPDLLNRWAKRLLKQSDQRGFRTDSELSGSAWEVGE